jgi:protein O-mannosyl-transferase
MKGNIAIENAFNRFGIIIFLLLAFLLYGNTIGHKFSLDDEFVINKEEVKGGFASIPKIFTSYYSENNENKYGYRPVTRAVFAIEYSIFGKNPAVFHLINVLLYGLLCWLLYIVLRRLRDNIPQILAILAVLIFLFHPVHTEVTNSLKNREELNCFILSLLSMLSFLHFSKKRNILSLISGGVLLFTAFLAKETAFVFILIIPVYLFLAGAGRIRLILSSIVAIVFVYAAYKMPSIVLPPAESMVENWQNPLFAEPELSNRIAMGMVTLNHYLFQLIFPYRLLFYYGYNTIPLPGIFDFTVIISFFVYLGIFFIAVFNFKRNKIVFFGIFFFYAAISLFSNIPIPITGIVADRLVFTASAGFSLILAWLLLKLISVPKLKITGLMLVAVIFILYSYRTVSRNKEWKNAETLYEADIKYLSNSVKANDLYASYMLNKANEMLAAGRKPAELTGITDKALKHFKIVTDLLPEYYNAWNNLGAIYLTYYNDTANALFAFNSAVKYKPGLVTAHHNIGYIYYRAKKYEQAKNEFLIAMSNDSDYIPSLFNYGEIMTLELKFDSAEQYFLRIYRQDSLYVGALLNLGSLEILKGDTLKAIKYFEPAVEKDKTNKALMMNISAYYNRKGDATKSEYYRKMAGQ